MGRTTDAVSLLRGPWACFHEEFHSCLTAPCFHAMGHVPDPSRMPWQNSRRESDLAELMGCRWSAPAPRGLTS